MSSAHAIAPSVRDVECRKVPLECTIYQAASAKSSIYGLGITFKDMAASNMEGRCC